MGIGQSEPENARFNPNFNLAEYNQKMNQMRSQYTNRSMGAPGAYYHGSNTKTSTMDCQ